MTIFSNGERYNVRLFGKKATKEQIEAQWKLLTRLAIVRWRKTHLDDKRNDDELAEQFMNEAQKEGWCRRGKDGEWQLKYLKLKRDEFDELGVE